MNTYDTNEVMKTYQELVDNGVITLEEAQDMFDDNLEELILGTKKEIDEAFDNGVISAYEKNICYINIGLDVDATYENVITNLIESELSLMEEKPKPVDSKNIPTKEEFYRKQMEKQAKKEKRKQIFKKVAGTAAAAGLVAGGAYLASKAEKSGNDRKVVRPDNEEYSQFFRNRDEKMKQAQSDYEAAMKKATTDVERDDINKQFNKRISDINSKFSQDVMAHKQAKRQSYNEERRKDKENFDREIQNTTDPEKRAELIRKHKEAQDRYDYDKENRKKVEKYDRSDYYRKQEINRADPKGFRNIDPDSLGPVGKFFFKGKQKRALKRVDKVNKKYDDYNNRNIN